MKPYFQAFLKLEDSVLVGPLVVQYFPRMLEALGCIPSKRKIYNSRLVSLLAFF